MRGRASRLSSLVVLIGVPVLVWVGCASQPRWRATRNPDALDAAAVLASDTGSLRRDLRPDEMPEIPVRRRLRPCCAFGSRLQVRVWAVKIPGVAIENVRSPDDIGHHNYDAGQRGRDDVAEGGERNGLVYTCRGGFVDIAHVRDYADWTLFLASWIGRHLETGAVIELPDDEGGRRRFVLEPVAPELVRDVGRRSMSGALAVWAGFQLSIWHEIATWYGWSAFGAFPERASAFSPEDIYSNLLGAKLVMPIIESGRDSSEDLFDRAVDVWLAQALAYLGAVDARLGEEAVRAVDQLWWDSNALLPDDDLVLRRNLQLGSTIEPWQVPDAAAGPALRDRLARHCDGELSPHRLRNPSRIPGLAFEDVLRFEVELEAGFAARPALAPVGPVVSQRDFPAILERIRLEVLEEFGPFGDRPEPAPGS